MRIVTRAYVVKMDEMNTTDVFESAKGAARFIVQNIGTEYNTRAYVSHVTVDQYDRSWFQTHSMGGGMSHVLKPMSNDELTMAWAQLFRKNPGKQITIQVNGVPVGSEGWLRPSVIVFRITNADYFKGRKYPRYVSRRALVEKYDEASRQDEEVIVDVHSPQDSFATRTQFGKYELSFESWKEEFGFEKEYGITFRWDEEFGQLFIEGPKENVKRFLKEVHYAGESDANLAEMFPELYED